MRSPTVPTHATVSTTILSVSGADVDTKRCARIRKTMAITHAHAFVMAIVFLILAHLFVSTSAPETLKMVVLTVAVVGTVGDLMSPWLVRYGAASCAWIALGSWIAQGAGNLVLLGVSGWECLRGQENG